MVFFRDLHPECPQFCLREISGIGMDDIFHDNQAAKAFCERVVQNDEAGMVAQAELFGAMQEEFYALAFPVCRSLRLTKQCGGREKKLNPFLDNLLSEVWERLQKNDWRALRRYRGECRLATYIRRQIEWQLKEQLREDARLDSTDDPDRPIQIQSGFRGRAVSGGGDDDPFGDDLDDFLDELDELVGSTGAGSGDVPLDRSPYPQKFQNTLRALEPKHAVRRVAFYLRYCAYGLIPTSELEAAAEELRLMPEALASRIIAVTQPFLENEVAAARVARESLVTRLTACWRRQQELLDLQARLAKHGSSLRERERQRLTRLPEEMESLRNRLAAWVLPRLDHETVWKVLAPRGKKPVAPPTVRGWISVIENKLRGIGPEGFGIATRRVGERAEVPVSTQHEGRSGRLSSRRSP